MDLGEEVEVEEVSPGIAVPSEWPADAPAEQPATAEPIPA